MEKVLITGISGGQGRLLARRLARRWEVCGVDRSPWRGAPKGVRVHKVDVRKRKFEDVLRTERPTSVVHMGFIRHFREGEAARHDVNVRGTKQLLDHCVKYGVERLVVMSSSYVYGAADNNPYSMDEDTLLSASRTYPEIRDLVEVDGLAQSFMWKHPEIRTCVLRPVNVLGPTVQSMAGSYLRQRRVPTLLGFDPMLQFIHEEDLADAIALAVECGLQGVFNVVGPGEVPVSTAIAETGGMALPVPDTLLRFGFDRMFRWGMHSYPPGLLDFLKYPVSISGKRFEAASEFRCSYSLSEIFQSVRH